MQLEFEFDPIKSAVNKDKHGIDFVEAQAIWSDENVIFVKATTLVEERWLAFGTIAGKLWTAVHMMRDEKVRLISVRRSREGERADYEQQ